MNRTDLWGRLAHTLRSECDAYRHFLQLLKEEAPCLQQLSPQALHDVTSQKTQVLALIQQLDGVRMGLLKRLAGPACKEDLIPWLARSIHPRASEAQAALKELVRFGREAKAHGKRNGALLSHAQYVVREALHVIYTGLGAQPLYGQSGQLSFPSVTGSVSLQG